MRRRALLAASQPSGGIETTLQFPLYIYFDYCEESFWGGYCYGEGDYAELNRLIKFVVETFGYDSGFNIVLYEEKLDELGLEIYVDGGKVRELSIEYDSSYMRTDAYYAINVTDTYIQCDF